MAKLPILYTAVVRAPDGHESAIDLESSGWRERPAFRNAVSFALQPKEACSVCGFPTLGGDVCVCNRPDALKVAALPAIIVDLSPLPDGTPREVIYFSRVFGRIVTNSQVSGADEMRNLLRLYCVGWKAEIISRVHGGAVSGRIVEAKSWIYPGGSVVLSDGEPQPPFVDELIEHYATERMFELGELQRPGDDVEVAKLNQSAPAL